MHIVFGTSLYGAVRPVARTRLVTKFWMLQYFPVFPLESCYERRPDKKARTDAPLLGGGYWPGALTYPCRRISLLSVAAAYVRGVAVVILLPAVLLLFMFPIIAMGDPAFRFDDEKKNMLAIGVCCLAGGSLLGLLSYVLTRRTPLREQRIRLSCARVLGIAADPACLRPDYAREIAWRIQEAIRQREASDSEGVPRRPTDSVDRDLLDLWLTYTRTQVQDVQQASVHEATTDRLLEAMDDFEGRRKEPWDAQRRSDRADRRPWPCF